ncbi:MAG: hypothetical protein EOO09_08695 [Chitinophagaceae bacterium]|nr:MAG: hypothetical protein EOO09_08695 [Chitinophagaceae bacterium]
MAKKVLLLFNPKAGHGQHDEEDLLKMVNDAGYDCKTRSIKDDGWEKIPSSVDMLAVAGGDGTVSKVIKRIYHRKKDEPDWPLGVLPFGTANNIATSIGATAPPEELVMQWAQGTTPFYLGQLAHATGNNPFCEMAGFGLFPQHLDDMQQYKGKELGPQDKLDAALRESVLSIDKLKPESFEIEGPGFSKNGNYITAIVMNTRYFGPGVSFAPDADHEDRKLELVLFSDEQRDELKQYYQCKVRGSESGLHPEIIRGSRFTIKTNAKRFHIEDEIFSVTAGEPFEFSSSPEPVRIMGTYR